jgi:hypothetical protein
MPLSNSRIVASPPQSTGAADDPARPGGGGDRVDIVRSAGVAPPDAPASDSTLLAPPGGSRWIRYAAIIAIVVVVVVLHAYGYG